MKKTSIILATATIASLAPAESVMKPINDKGYGTISGRIHDPAYTKKAPRNGTLLDSRSART